jgi:hypothetical protein
VGSLALDMGDEADAAGIVLELWHIEPGRRGTLTVRICGVGDRARAHFTLQ